MLDHDFGHQRVAYHTTSYNSNVFFPLNFNKPRGNKAKKYLIH